MNRLITAITEDVTAYQNEQAETMGRTAGYWRYVSKRTYNFMVRNNKIWDWATGEKLYELDDADEDALEDDERTLVGSPPIESTRGRTNDAIDYLTQEVDQAFNIRNEKDNDKTFASPTAQRDDRYFTRTIREASPPREDLEPKTRSWVADRKRTVADTEENIKQAVEYSNNMYDALHAELPAPREDPLPLYTTPTPKQRKGGKPSIASKADFPALFPAPGSTPKAGQENTPHKISVLRITASVIKAPSLVPLTRLPKKDSLASPRSKIAAKTPNTPKVIPEPSSVTFKPISWAGAVKGPKKG